MARAYTNWVGRSDDTAGDAPGGITVINTDMRVFGELRRRPGMSAVADILATALLAFEASGRYYLVSYASGSIGATRLT